jgi:hypothetical protein
MIAMFQDHYSGMDSLRAFLSAALWVNANVFQTDLCRNPEHWDVKLLPHIAPKIYCCGIGKLPSMALDTGIHAGMTVLAEVPCYQVLASNQPSTKHTKLTTFSIYAEAAANSGLLKWSLKPWPLMQSWG